MPGFWTVQAGIGLVGIACLVLVGLSSPACTSSEGGACSPVGTSTSTETETSLGCPDTGTETDTQTQTYVNECPPDPAAVAFLEQLPAKSGSVAAFSFAAIGSATCAPPSVGATVTDPMRAQAVFAALLANALAMDTCTYNPPPPCGVLYRVKFLAGDASVIVEADFAFGTLAPQSIGPWGVVVDPAFFKSLADGLEVNEASIYPWCQAPGCFP